MNTPSLTGSDLRGASTTASSITPGKGIRGTKRQLSLPRLRRSTGNVIVESVFTLLPTFAVLCAFADFGMALFRWTTLQNAVREGARYAITFQTGSTGHQDSAIQAIVQQYAFGIVKATDSPQHIFVNYYSTANMNTPIAAPGGNVPGNIVEVSVQNVSWPWLAPLSGVMAGPLYRTSPITFAVYSSDILGGYPAGVTSVTR